MAERSWVVNIPQGWFMSWFVTTQAASKVTVNLADTKKKYIDEKSQQSCDINPPLAAGYGFVEGADLKLTISISGSRALKGEPHASDILTSKGAVVGKEFVMSIEDSEDDDYNDVAISIIAWRSKG